MDFVGLAKDSRALWLDPAAGTYLLPHLDKTPSVGARGLRRKILTVAQTKKFSSQLPAEQSLGYCISRNV